MGQQAADFQVVHKWSISSLPRPSTTQIAIQISKLLPKLIPEVDKKVKKRNSIWVSKELSSTCLTEKSWIVRKFHSWATGLAQGSWCWQCLLITFPGIDASLLFVWLEGLVCLIHRNIEPLAVQHSLESCLSWKERQQKAVWGATAPVAQIGSWRYGTTAWGPACSDIVFCLIVERLLPVFCMVKSLSSLSSLLRRIKIWKILPPRNRYPVVSGWQFEKIAQSEKDNFVLRKSSPHPQWVF